MYDRIKPYNQLPPLPGEFTLDAVVLQRWGYASRALAELNGNLKRLPNPDMLVNTVSLKEAKSSSAIENIFTTDDELFKALSDSVREEQANPATKEVLRYREALWTGYREIVGTGKIDQNCIINIYRKVKNTNEGIRPPQSQVVIRRGNSEFRAGAIVYTPPRGKGVVEEKLRGLLDFLEHSDASDLDPLLKMVLAHYQFEAIHPFSDGNGRTGRILNLLYLVKEGLLSHPGLYLSRYIINTKSEYYHHLAGVTQRQDWKSWTLYMLEAVRQTSIETNRMIEEIMDQMAATLDYGKQNIRWYSKDVNEALFAQPYIKPQLLGKVLGRTSRTTLTGYMEQLTRHKILSARQDGKEVFYLNNDLIRILEGE